MGVKIGGRADQSLVNETLPLRRQFEAKIEADAPGASLQDYRWLHIGGGGRLGITVAGQTVAFLGALAFGFLMGILYDLFRVARSYCKRRVVPFFLDVSFWLLAGFFTFFYLLLCGEGEIRGFILLGELIGIVVYKCLIGSAFYRLIRMIINGTGRACNRAIVPVWNKTRQVGGYIGKKTKKNGKKIGISLKNCLKSIGMMVYNKSDHVKKKNDQENQGRKP